jgi:peptide/nickel transport system substrate-binding protein
VALLAVGLVLTAALLFGLVTSSLAAEEATAPSETVVLKIGWMDDVDHMNPFIGWVNNVYEVYANEYLRLVEEDPATMEPGPNGVAKSWEVSDDELTWTFHLNEGITWHDGEPLTADDVAFTYNYIIENEMAAFISFVAGVDRVEVVDDYTVDFVCSKPKSNLLQLFIPILPEHIWKDIDPEDAGGSYPNKPPVVGSGPFQVTDWKKGRYLKMEAYDDFFLGRPAIDEILYVVYKNPDTLVQDLKSGNIDAAYLFPQAQYDALESDPNIETISYTWRNWDYIGFNTYTGPSKGHPALTDASVRQALEYAIDRERIVEISYSGFAIPGWSFMPPDNWTNPDYHWEPAEGERRDFDPDRAREMLDAAGLKDSDGDGVREYEGKPVKLRLWANTRSPEAERSGKLIAGWWKDVGIEVELSVLDNGVYFEKIWNYQGDTFTPDFDAYIWQWDGYLDPGQSLDCFTTAQIEGWNEMAWSNPTYDDLNVRQNETLDRDARADLIKQMQATMYGDASTIVFAHPYKLQAYRSDRWDGFERALGGKGPAFASCTYAWAYLDVKPAQAEAEQSSSTTWIWVVVAVAFIAVVGLVLVRRGRGRAMEE